jgi:pimeloyl-ACP methyl ester carboxylesterase
VPEHFERLFPKELMLRPIQLRAAAEDAALMTPAVVELQKHYRELQMPVVILTGADDQVVDVNRQSGRLHKEMKRSEFVALPGLGHMVHHLAPDEVIRAVDQAARMTPPVRQMATEFRSKPETELQHPPQTMTIGFPEHQRA